MACSGVEMFLDALLDRRLPPPGNHGVEKAVAATVRQVILAEAEAQPVVTVIGQGHVKCQRLTSYLAGLGGVLDEQYFLLDAHLGAIAKGAIVFAGALALSWATTAAVCRIPLGARVMGRKRRELVRAP